MSMYLGGNLVAPTKLSNDAYGWIGTDVEYVGKLYEWNGTLGDTTYSSWTPSTSTGTVLASASNVASLTIPDRTKETYYFLGRWGINFAYNSGTSMTYAPTKWTAAGLYEFYNYPSNIAQYLSGEYPNYSSMSAFVQYILFYYNSSGTLNYSSNSYGPAYSTTGITVGMSTSGNQTTLNFTRPALSAKCSTSYFTTDRAADIDTANSTIKYRIDVFKGPINGGAVTHRYRLITDIYNDNWNL